MVGLPPSRRHLLVDALHIHRRFAHLHSRAAAAPGRRNCASLTGALTSRRAQMSWPRHYCLGQHSTKSLALTL